MEKFKVFFVNEKAADEVLKLPLRLKARTEYLIELMKEVGPNLGEPHSKKLEGERYKGLFGLRAKAQEGISRSIYCTTVGKEIYVLHSFVKKTDKTPKKHLEVALKRMEEI